MFLVRPEVKLYPLKEHKKEGKYTVWSDTTGLAFGGGADFWMEDCKIKFENGCQTPITFDFDPSELSGVEEKDDTRFHYFIVEEYEVFSIEFLK